MVAYYDTFLKKYVAYVRDWDVGARSQREGLVDDRGLSWIAVGRRSIGRTETDDFRKLSPVRHDIDSGGPICRRRMSFTPTARRRSPARRTCISCSPPFGIRRVTQLALSSPAAPTVKAGTIFPAGPVLETSPFGQWDGGCVFAGPGLVEFSDGTWALAIHGVQRPAQIPPRRVGEQSRDRHLAAWAIDLARG